MMSTKQLACMLTLHIIYLLLGASIFYHIESPLERAQRGEEKLERLEIQNLLYENYIPTDPDKQDVILQKLSDYCGKSLFNYTTEDEEPPIKWDFYHSFFFSYTVVSTIGYGNLSPTAHLSRILMIFYGLFGIPINGILLANLGEYFGMQIISIYRRYKKRDERRADKLDGFFHNLGMLGQIFLCLVPGFLFFMFLPACIFVVFEGWDYVAAVYYAFVTLTTIGFGDIVAGTKNNGFAGGYFLAYEIFLIVWITFGLGYIAMLLGFITTGLRSEGVHKIEQKIANQLKQTQNRILQGFSRDMTVIRKLINEANLIKLKPIYVETAPYLYKSKSCPILTFDVEPRGPIFGRRRANSENIHLSALNLARIQSDTDLLGIDREKTFTATAIVKPAELLARVVNVLGEFDHKPEERGIHMFDDEEILESEKSPWSIGPESILKQNQSRGRALSVAVPNYRKDSVAKTDHEVSWTNGDSTDQYKETINRRAGKLSLPIAHPLTLPDEKPKPAKGLLSKLFHKQNPVELMKTSMKDIIVAQDEHRNEIYDGGNPNLIIKDKPRQRRTSIFPTFDFAQEDENFNAYKEKTKKGRRSIFPSFDFTEEEDTAAYNAYRGKTKRHSIFPTFDFSEDEDEKQAKAYRDKTRSGRKSIFPTFDFSVNEDEEEAKKYKESTRRGRKSIFPTFDFKSKEKEKEEEEEDDDVIDEEELRRYQNKTRRGRLSLFPTFGKNKKQSDDETVNEQSEELKDYKNKTNKGRGSLFQGFSKNRSISTTDNNGMTDLEADIKAYQNRTNRGRNSLFAGDLQQYNKSTQGGRNSLFGSDDSGNEDQSTEVLEQTSVADLLRALAILETSTAPNQRGMLDASKLFTSLSNDVPTEAQRTKRRGSVHPDFALPKVNANTDNEDSTGPRRRRVSARAAASHFTPTLATVVAGSELQTTAKAARENRMNMISHPTSETNADKTEELQPSRVRRFSNSPTVASSKNSVGPVSRLSSRARKESVTSIEEESNSRKNSLTDIVIDKS